MPHLQIAGHSILESCSLPAHCSAHPLSAAGKIDLKLFKKVIFVPKLLQNRTASNFKTPKEISLLPH